MLAVQKSKHKLNNMAKPSKSSQAQELDQQLALLTALVQDQKLPTIEPLLPTLLTLRGKPFDLKGQFHFSSLFRLKRPQKVMYKCGRQTGKSMSFAADSVVTSAIIPHFSTLHITPLFEQIRRFSTLYVRPFVQESPLRNLWTGTSTESSVLQRTFRNGSRMMFSYASTDADRVRGLAVNKTVLDELQDIDKDLIPIILEIMSADREYGIEQYAGTPKTLDNTLELYWQRSSQAEWWIPCTHCTTDGHPTWNIPSAEYHIMDMIGPLRDDISPDRPAILCHKCRQFINPRFGHWEHRYPERRWNFAGYHVPQIIIPLHYDSRKKWAALLQKQNTVDNATFYNEVLGESRDEGQKLISLTELRSACSLPWRNDERNPDPQILERLGQYRSRVLAIDWGGGGESGLSLTVMALVCMTPDGMIEIPWAKKSFGVDHIAEAREAIHWFEYFNCDMLTHDYTGAGILRETLLIQAGLPMSRDMPIQYVRSSVQDLLVKVPASEMHRRDHWRLDKTRSLHYTIFEMRLGRVKFFEYDNHGDDDPGMVDHFLRLIENRSSIETTNTGYRIISNGLGPDDFAQAVNLGCVCTWEINDAYPNLAAHASMELTPKINPTIDDYFTYGWDVTDIETASDRYY